MSSRYCKRGHPMTAEHGRRVTTQRNGRDHEWWDCRTCRKFRDRHYYAARAGRSAECDAPQAVAASGSAEFAALLGRQLRAARAERGLSEKDAAAAAGLWPTALRAIESGELRNATLTTLLRLCGEYGVTVEVRPINETVARYRAEAEAARARRAQRDLFATRPAQDTHAVIESCRAEFERATRGRSA